MWDSWQFLVDLGGPSPPQCTCPSLLQQVVRQAGTADRLLSRLLVNGEAKVVTNEAIRVVARGQVDAVAVALADVPLVPASLDDVRVYVEVGE